MPSSLLRALPAVLVSVFLTGCEEGSTHGRTEEVPADAGVVDSAAGDSGASGPSYVEATPGTDRQIKLTHAGVERAAWVHVPTSYDPTRNVPVVLDFHGLNGTAELQKSISGWRAKSNQEGFLLVHPEGLKLTDASGQSWNAGSLCCGDALEQKVDDEGFVLALLAQLKRDYPVDAKRVYVTGLSNGGAMTHLLACRHADLFAAVAPAAMSNGTTPCEPARGISVLMFRATADILVPYGPSTSRFSTAQADFESWKVLNQCSGEPTVQGDCQTYSQCKDGAEVTLCTLQTTAADEPWGGHLTYPYADRAGIPFTSTAWAMFQRHTLP